MEVTYQWSFSLDPTWRVLWVPEHILWLFIGTENTAAGITITLTLPRGTRPGSNGNLLKCAQPGGDDKWEAVMHLSEGFQR